MFIRDIQKYLNLFNEAAAAAQRADFNNYSYDALPSTPKVYPNALGKPDLSMLSRKDIKACKDIAKIFPSKEIFWLGKNQILKNNGLEHGEVYASGSFIRKFVSEKRRFKMDTVIDTLRTAISSLTTSKLARQRQKGVVKSNAPVVIESSVNIFGIDYKVIIARRGKMRNCIMTIYEE